MREFTNAFLSAGSTVLSENAHINAEWSSDPMTLKIFASSDAGFDVELVCEDYGVYPHAGDWHFSPWDVTGWTPDALAKSVTEFLQAVLSMDSKLEVSYSNGKPFKAVLRCRCDGQWVIEETGLIFFNWFGRRTVKKFQNDWLPGGQLSGVAPCDQGAQ